MRVLRRPVIAARARPELSPILDLSGDRSLGHFRCKPSVEDEFIGEYDRLTHVGMVA